MRVGILAGLSGQLHAPVAPLLVEEWLWPPALHAEIIEGFWQPLRLVVARQHGGVWGESAEQGVGGL